MPEVVARSLAEGTLPKPPGSHAEKRTKEGMRPTGMEGSSAATRKSFCNDFGDTGMAVGKLLVFAG